MTRRGSTTRARTNPAAPGRVARGILAAVVLTSGSWGCSAIVSPDPSRLGGGSVGTDAGRLDAFSANDAFSVNDAFSPSGCTGTCDDGVGCTVDSCNVNVCQNLPDDGRCAPSERCVPGGCVPRMMCGDAEICGNGVDDDCDAATSDVCPTTVPDDCGSAQLVDLSSGSAVVRGDFGAPRADYPTYCIQEGPRARRDPLALGFAPARLRVRPRCAGERRGRRAHLR